MSWHQLIKRQVREVHWKIDKYQCVNWHQRRLNNFQSSSGDLCISTSIFTSGNGFITWFQYAFFNWWFEKKMSLHFVRHASLSFHVKGSAVRRICWLHLLQWANPYQKKSIHNKILNSFRAFGFVGCEMSTHQFIDTCAKWPLLGKIFFLL